MSSNPEQSSSTMSSPSLVWFQIMDSATGMPYKGTSADKVSIFSSADVADFRYAVIKKYKDEDSTILTSFKSCNLSVYNNKAAFEKRNAAVNDGKEERLETDEPLGLLGSEEDMLVVVVPSSTTSRKLDQLEQEIKALENSDEFKTLASKNRACVVPKPTEQEKGEWQLLKEKLAYLKKKEDFYITRNEYKTNIAIKDERRLLCDVAIKMWERFGFTCWEENMPMFHDLKKAAGFNDVDDVCNYFQKKAIGEVKEDVIKESLTKKAWIWLIELNEDVNPVLQGSIRNQDGSLQLVLEHDIYEQRNVVENIIHQLYGSSQMVHIKDASCNLSNSPYE